MKKHTATDPTAYLGYDPAKFLGVILPAPAPAALFDLTDPRYLRRLVKALNEHDFNGFYGAGGRYTRARLHKGKLQVTFAMTGWRDVAPEETFVTPGGKEIYASRHPKYP